MGLKYKNYNGLGRQSGLIIEALIRRLATEDLGFKEAKYTLSELKYLAHAVGGNRYQNVITKYNPTSERGWLDAMFKLDLVLDLSSPTEKCRVGFDISGKEDISALQAKSANVVKTFGVASSLLVEHHVVLRAGLPRYGGWGLYPQSEKDRVLGDLEGIIYDALEVSVGSILYLEL